MTRQAQHIQDLVDELGADESELCHRSSCWRLGAGSLSCWVHVGDERCTQCGHLADCHPPDGAARGARWFRERGQTAPWEDATPLLGVI